MRSQFARTGRFTHPMKEDVKEKTPPRPSEDVGVVTYIQPHHILREVIGLVALARRTF